MSAKPLIEAVFGIVTYHPEEVEEVVGAVVINESEEEAVLEVGCASEESELDSRAADDWVLELGSSIAESVDDASSTAVDEVSSASVEEASSSVEEEEEEEEEEGESLEEATSVLDEVSSVVVATAVAAYSNE
ncbi:hypothetical protein PP707_06370, partial [Acetobacter pasteurianus]|nr:hypothetical protein [Acetobacter pasteurianus]